MRKISSMNHMTSMHNYFRFMKVRFAGRTHHSQKLSD